MRTLSLALALLALTFTATAQQPSQETVRVGSRAFPIRIQGSGEDATLRVGSLRHRLPGGAESLNARVVGDLIIVSADAATLLIRVRGGRPSLLWQGSTAWRGDIGERRRDQLEVADRTGDGVDDVIVGYHQEGRSICGESHTLLAPQAYDPRGGRLRPVTLRRVPEAPMPEVAASTEALVGSEPLAPLLRPRSASSRQGGDGPPVRLTDGETTSGWVEAAPGDGQWEFVTLALDGQVPVEALRIHARVPEAAAARGLWVIGEETRFYVRFPNAPVAEQALWARAPQPIEGQCVSLVLDSGDGPHSGLAEVTGYSALDFGGGLEQLVERLARSPRESQAAAQLLRRVGAPAIGPLMSAYGEMTGRERALAVGVFAAVDGPAAQEALVHAITANPELGETVVEALVQRGDQGYARLVSLIALGLEHTEMVSLAAYALAQVNSTAAHPAILAAISIGHWSDTIRRAYVRASHDADPDAIIAFAANAPIEALARFAWAAAGTEQKAGLARALARAAEASSFESRYFFALAAQEAERNPDLQAWITDMMSAEEWMLRAAIVEALDPEQDADLLRRAMADDYPRVRAGAIQRIGASAWATAAMATLARRDPWAFVRAEALQAAVAGAPDASEPLLAAALGDNHERVRAAAIHALPASHLNALRPQILQRLRDDEEWPSVLQAGAELAQRTCDPRLVPGLSAIVDRALRPNAWEPDVEVAAQAIAVLAAIGGDEALGIIENAKARGPVAIRAAADGSAAAEACR